MNGKRDEKGKERREEVWCWGKKKKKGRKLRMYVNYVRALKGGDQIREYDTKD